MDVFILGVERSATTWLSNILEAHPRTDVYAEPMAIFTTYFEKWPDRFQKIEDQGNMADYFVSEFNKIKKEKRFFLSKIYDSPFTWKLDFKLAKICDVRFKSNKARNYRILNFHRREQDFHFDKTTTTSIDVIKELRLNFNPHLLTHINPQAKIIIVVRNYASNIKSIVKYVKAGRLIELKKLLDLKGSKKDYTVLMNYWLNSYNSLFEGLEDSNLEYITISHKNMLANGEGEIAKLYNFLNLELDEQVVSYFNFSNRSGEGIHNTNRDHRDLLERDKKNKIEMDGYLKVEDIGTMHKKVKEVI